MERPDANGIEWAKSRRLKGGSTSTLPGLKPYGWIATGSHS